MNSGIDWARNRAACTTEELFEEVKQFASKCIEELKAGDLLDDRSDFEGVQVDELEERLQKIGVLRFKNLLPEELRTRDNGYAWLTYSLQDPEIVAELQVGDRRESWYATAYWSASEDTCSLRVTRESGGADVVMNPSYTDLDVAAFVRWSLEPFLFPESDD